MGLNRIICSLILTAAFLTGSRNALAVESTNAELPYNDLDKLCEMVKTVDQTKLIFGVTLSSHNKAVHPADIAMTIQSAKGAIPLQLGTNGQILNFPHDPALVRENPLIVANQPKGTMSYFIKMMLPVPNELTFHYSRLSDGVGEANKLIRAQAGMMLSLLAPKAQGVVFIFPKASAGKAKFLIISKSGRKELTADAKGHIKLKLEKSLVLENPEVQLSEKPDAIAPDIK